MRILKKLSYSFVSVKNGQINSKDIVKVLKGGEIGSYNWNPALICFLFALQKGVPVFCNNLTNCRLHCVGFIALIAQMRFYYPALFFKDFIRRADPSDSDF